MGGSYVSNKVGDKMGDDVPDKEGSQPDLTAWWPKCVQTIWNIHFKLLLLQSMPKKSKLHISRISRITIIIRTSIIIRATSVIATISFLVFFHHHQAVMG